jgi:hypothetical protein
MIWFLVGGLVATLVVSRWQWKKQAEFWKQAYLLEHANHLNTVECATEALTQMQEDYLERPQHRDLQVPFPLNDPRLN